MRRKVSILGATGSIGTSTLDLIERSPERFEVIALTAARDVKGLADAARRTGAKLAVIAVTRARREEGSSGLALGDHLHFEVLINGVSVTPLEWWDARWIRDHVGRPHVPPAVHGRDQRQRRDVAVRRRCLHRQTG